MSLGFVPVVELDGRRTILVAPANCGGDGGPLEEQLGENDACARAVVQYMNQRPTRVWWLDDWAAESLYDQLWDAGVDTEVPNVPDDLPASVFEWRYLINHDKQVYVDLALVWSVPPTACQFTPTSATRSTNSAAIRCRSWPPPPGPARTSPPCSR